MEYLLLLAVALCGTVVCGQMGGPMPLPMPGSGNGPMNPFTGPQQQMPARQMNMGDPRNRNNNNNNMNNNRNNNNNMRNQRPPQQRSQTDQMLDNMGMGGIQPFYAALAGELTRSPSGMGMGGQEGMQGRY